MKALLWPTPTVIIITVPRSGLLVRDPKLQSVGFVVEFVGLGLPLDVWVGREYIRPYRRTG